MPLEYIKKYLCKLKATIKIIIEFVTATTEVLSNQTGLTLDQNTYSARHRYCFWSQKFLLFQN